MAPVPSRGGTRGGEEGGKWERGCVKGNCLSSLMVRHSQATRITWPARPPYVFHVNAPSVSCVPRVRVRVCPPPSGSCHLHPFVRPTAQFRGDNYKIRYAATETSLYLCPMIVNKLAFQPGDLGVDRVRFLRAGVRVIKGEEEDSFIFFFVFFFFSEIRERFCSDVRGRGC